VPGGNVTAVLGGIVSESPVIFAMKEEHAGKTKEEQSALLDLEVQAFSDWFATLSPSQGGGVLTKAERMLVKTYMVQKLSGRI
jgi:hypothetical protein